MSSLRSQLLLLHDAINVGRTAMRHVAVDVRRLAETKAPGAERARLNLDARRLTASEARLAVATAALEWSLRFLR